MLLIDFCNLLCMLEIRKAMMSTQCLQLVSLRVNRSISMTTEQTAKGRVMWLKAVGKAGRP